MSISSVATCTCIYPGLQARAKALREQQRTRLDARHKYVLGLVASRLELEEAAVEDFMLDGDQVRCSLFTNS